MRIFLLVILFSTGMLWPAVSVGQVYNTDQTKGKIVVSNILIVGNKKTKEKVILRELNFSSGDSLGMRSLNEKIELSKRNLNNTSLFLEVDIKPIPVDGRFFDILITVKERWYFWPSPGIELADPNINTWWETKDFSRINLRLSLNQGNFRGRVPQEDLDVFTAIKEKHLAFTIISQKRIPEQIIEKAKKAKECPHCGKTQYELIFTKPTIFVEKTEIGEHRLLPITIRNMSLY